MRADWNARAAENARYYVATSDWKSEDAFRSSGERDVGYFYDGLERVLGPEIDALDIGCGVGRMDEFVAPRVRHLTGLDVSKEMVRQARERLGHLPNVEFVVGSGTGLDVLGDERFDLVMSHIVFHHLPRSFFHGYLPEVHRVLRPGGHFVFQLPEAHPEDAPKIPEPDDSDTFSMRFYVEDELRSTLEGLGFVWEECRRFPIDTTEPRIDYLRIACRKPA